MSDSSAPSSNKKVMGLVVVLLLASLAGNAFLGSMFWQMRQENMELKQDPQRVAQAELAEVMEAVSKIITLPQGVTPTLATVNNAESLKEQQPFFKDAQDGDKMLLYAQTTDAAERKAYLYRPSTNQLINVAPINVGGQIVAQQDEFSIDIRNGTPTEGLEDQMESLLGRIFPNANVAVKGLAANQEYTRSQLVRVNADEALAQKIATLFNVPLGELPEGEAPAGDVDLVLILGRGEDQQDVREALVSPSPAATTAPQTQEEPAGE